MSLSDEQIDLYSRQILLREVGGAGQRRLLDARCLLIGSDAAVDTAATYLAGAGVGRIERISATIDPRARPIAFAPLPDRVPGTATADLGTPEAVDLAGVDVLILGPRRFETRLHGAPRRGTITVSGGSELPGAQVVLIPSGENRCFACLRVVPPSTEAIEPIAVGHEPATEPQEAHPLALESCFAGVMGALAACRWILDLGSDSTARALYLAPDAPTWEEAGLDPIEPCPRGCRGGPGPVDDRGGASPRRTTT